MFCLSQLIYCVFVHSVLTHVGSGKWEWQFRTMTSRDLVRCSGAVCTRVAHEDVVLLGASGGVYALLAAHLADVILVYAGVNSPGGVSDIKF